MQTKYNNQMYGASYLLFSILDNCPYLKMQIQRDITTKTPIVAYYGRRRSTINVKLHKSKQIQRTRNMT